MQYLCGMKWGMNMAMANEFGHDRCTPALNASCAYLLSANDSSDEDYWIYGLVLLGAFAAFRLVALGALVSKARHFY